MQLDLLSSLGQPSALIAPAARRTDPSTSHAAAERWRQIPGYSRYSVSTRGQVRRDTTVYRTQPGICKQSVKNGYPQVAVTSDDGVNRTEHVHRLLMRAFVGVRPAGMVVCHGNGNGMDCTLENLRYDTYQGNANDSIKHGTQAKGESIHQHKLTEEDVKKIVDWLERGGTYLEIGGHFGVTKHAIFRIANGRNWKHITGGIDRRNGYKFAGRGALAAKQKRDLKRDGMAAVVQDGGKDMTRDGFRVWEAVHAGGNA